MSGRTYGALGFRSPRGLYSPMRALDFDPIAREEHVHRARARTDVLTVPTPSVADRDSFSSML